MANISQIAEVDVELLTDLLNYRRQYFKICDKFAILTEKRGEEWAGNGIIERINTYLTSYTLRKLVTEKEGGQAFREGPTTPLLDPIEPEVDHVKT